MGPGREREEHGRGFTGVKDSGSIKRACPAELRSVVEPEASKMVNRSPKEHQRRCGKGMNISVNLDAVTRSHATAELRMAVSVPKNFHEDGNSSGLILLPSAVKNACGLGLQASAKQRVEVIVRPAKRFSTGCLLNPKFPLPQNNFLSMGILQRQLHSNPVSHLTAHGRALTHLCTHCTYIFKYVLIVGKISSR